MSVLLLVELASVNPEKIQVFQQIAIVMKSGVLESCTLLFLLYLLKTSNLLCIIVGSLPYSIKLLEVTVVVIWNYIDKPELN